MSACSSGSTSPPLASRSIATGGVSGVDQVSTKKRPVGVSVDVVIGVGRRQQLEVLPIHPDPVEVAEVRVAPGLLAHCREVDDVAPVSSTRSTCVTFQDPLVICCFWLPVARS